MFRLDDRVAIVTGGARGLGRVLAHGLAGAGAAVVVADRDLPGGERVAAELRAASHRALAVGVDIAQRASCEGLVARTVDSFGRVDILVNNAAIDVIEPALTAEPADWARIVEVNLTGSFHCAQLAARQMTASGRGGAIINISSVAGVVGIPHLAAYGAAKAGLNQLTRALAVELAAHRIRVNAVAPGYLENVMAGAEAVHADPAKEDTIRRRTPLGRRARLDELVGPVIFLASDAASYVTGAVLAVDGGYSAA
jgi:NAD(P)-dependent dehydrogenase (short-subunit alcohol dehydrogenase family)